MGVIKIYFHSKSKDLKIRKINVVGKVPKTGRSLVSRENYFLSVYLKYLK